jgi:LEA14-like dessication related protein
MRIGRAAIVSSPVHWAKHALHTRDDFRPRYRLAPLESPYEARIGPRVASWKDMTMIANRTVRIVQLLLVFVALLSLGGCAGMFGGDPLRVSVAGIEPLAGQGMEMRFNLKLRVQNPNDSPIDFNGVSVELDLNGKPFASGVSDQTGTVPRFGETVIGVPLTVPALAAVRQAFAFADSAQSGQLPYMLRGRLAGGITGGTRFSDQGKLSLPTGDMSGM